MAPTFLQKLVKVANPISSNSQHNRTSSESSSSIAKPPSSNFSINRSRSPSASTNTNGSNPLSSKNTLTHRSIVTARKPEPANNAQDIQGSINSNKPIPTILTTRADGGRDDGLKVVGHQGSFDTLDTVSTQPNVTIVPPSPFLGSKELESDFEDQDHEGEVVVGVHRQTGPVSGSSTTKVVPPKIIEVPFQHEADDSSTPTPASRNQNPIASPPTSAKTISTITNNNGDDRNSNMSGGSFATGSFLRKQTSDKSITKSVGKKTPTSDLQIDTHPVHHTRAATAPADTSHPPQNSEAGPAPMGSIVESPTEVQPPSNALSDSQTNGPMASRGNPPSPKGAGVQPDAMRSAVSVASNSSVAADGNKGTRRPWKRASRKPTGLASAIAASGFAIAQPTLSRAHAAQAAAQISPAPSTGPQSGKSAKSVGSLPSNGSPPYLSKSPTQSTISNRSSQGKNATMDLSPRSNRSSAGNTKKGLSPGTRQSRPRRTSRATSVKSEAAGSEYSAVGPSSARHATSTTASMNGDDLSSRPGYYSGLELDINSSEEDDSGSDLSDGAYGDGDDFDDMPVTGFAVASTKRNQDFHEVFPSVPEGDYLIEDYGCALQREILIQGRIYISENHICFHANIFGWITDLSIPVYEITLLEKKMTAFVIPNAIQITTRQAKYTFTSFLSRDTTFDVMHNIWRLRQPEDNTSLLSGSGRGSLEGPSASPPSVSNGDAPGAIVPSAVVKVPALKKATICACGREGKHYSEIAMEAVIPGTPEKINTLLFASGFIKEFMSDNQKLLDIQMSDWVPVSPGSKLLTRNMSYIKPLAGSLGPKQTKCEIKNELVHSDFDEYISTMTTTRTPDVPSGGVFAVKTRTCVMWASPVSSKVLITTQIEWSGRSFIKGIIEKSAIDGQKQYHADLEKAMRAYIQEHQSEFLPEGVQAAAVADIEESEMLSTETDPLLDEKHKPTPEELKQRERERNARGLQWAWDTFDGAYQVAKRSTKGALELIRDAWDQSTSTTILWFLIVILVLSNLWTLMRMGSNTAEAARKLEVRKVEEREKWVQSIVAALWEEVAAGKVGPTVPVQPSEAATPTEAPAMSPLTDPMVAPTQRQVSAPLQSVTDFKEDVKQLQKVIETLEQRVAAIEQSLVSLEGLNALD